jgi:hypothetical protein
VVTESPIFITVLLFVASSAAASAAWSTYWFNNKSYKRNGLLEAFKLLSESGHRESRRVVYALHDQYNSNRDEKIFIESDLNRRAVEMVRADFDQMGTFVRNRSITKNDFLNAYGETVFRCWRALEPHILTERQQRHFEYYMKNFEWLSDEAIKYWQKRGFDLTSESLIPGYTTELHYHIISCLHLYEV